MKVNQLHSTDHGNTPARLVGEAGIWEKMGPCGLEIVHGHVPPDKPEPQGSPRLAALQPWLCAPFPSGEARSTHPMTPGGLLTSPVNLKHVSSVPTLEMPPSLLQAVFQPFPAHSTSCGSQGCSWVLLSLRLNFCYENIASVRMRPGMFFLPCPPAGIFLRKSLGFPSWESLPFSTSHFDGSQN